MTAKLPDSNRASLEQWRNSRSGAWAARGFDYQHLVSTLMLVRQCASLAPAGHLVPEGFDDRVVEFGSAAIWIQAKSRHNRVFLKPEVDGFRRAAAARADELPASPDTRTAILLEQPIFDMPSVHIDRLFDDDSGNAFVCRSPGNEILDLLSQQLNIAQGTAEGIANDLYRLVVDT